MFTLAESLKEPLPDLPQREHCPVTDKVSFPSKRAAQRALVGHNRNKTGIVSAYCCGWCGKWHLGKRR